MIHYVEALYAKFRDVPLGDRELLVQRKIHHRIAGPRDDVAPRIAKGIWSGRCEGGSIEPVLRRTLARWQADRLTGHKIRPLDGACIRDVRELVERIERGSILHGQIAAQLPAPKAPRNRLGPCRL